jgi:hypothetical protein
MTDSCNAIGGSSLPPVPGVHDQPGNFDKPSLGPSFPDVFLLRPMVPTASALIDGAVLKGT